MIRNYKLLEILRRIPRNYKTGQNFLCTQSRKINEIQKDQNVEFISFHGDWPNNEQEDFIKDMKIIPSFITIEEEKQLLDEVEPHLKRLRYEFDHWDDAIHGYRETERKNWYPQNRLVIEKIRKIAFEGDIMQYVHVLDLAEDGVIKPHVDSTRYCGTTIAGLSLLSDCIMRLVRTDEKKYLQNSQESNSNDYRNQLTSSEEFKKKYNFYADICLNRRSLYIMSHTARYNFTHEIIGKDLSVFNGKAIEKNRRISIICRNDP